MRCVLYMHRFKISTITEMIGFVIPVRLYAARWHIFDSNSLNKQSAAATVHHGAVFRASEYTVITRVYIIANGNTVILSSYLTRMALSRACASDKAADSAKLLLLTKRPVKHAQCHGVSLGPPNRNFKGKGKGAYT